MRVFRTFGLCGLMSLPFAAPALAEASITVTGEASIAAAPDMATITLGVTTDAATAAEALSANSTALAAVMARLQAAGIAELDLQTVNLPLNPNWVGYGSDQTPRVAGYIATNMLAVRVRDLEVLGAVLDASVADGANTLNGINFELSTPGPVKDAARKAAMADAMAKAKLYAEAAGVKLGAVQSISEQQNYGGPMPVFMDAKVAAPVPVASGQIATHAQVTVVFEIAN